MGNLLLLLRFANQLLSLVAGWGSHHLQSHLQSRLGATELSL